MPKNSNTDPKPQCVQTDVSKSVILSTDLRIGNFIEKNGDICTLASVNTDKTIRIYNEDKTDTWGCFALRIFNPIEITEDWLCKLGFNKTGGTYEFIDGLVELVFHKGEVYEVIEGQWKSFKHIKHIHQLQNLYFALTGSELTVC